MNANVAAHEWTTTTTLTPPPPFGPLRPLQPLHRGLLGGDGGLELGLQKNFTTAANGRFERVCNEDGNDCHWRRSALPDDQNGSVGTTRLFIILSAVLITWICLVLGTMFWLEKRRLQSSSSSSSLPRRRSFRRSIVPLSQDQQKLYLEHVQRVCANTTFCVQPHHLCETREEQCSTTTLEDTPSPERARDVEDGSPTTSNTDNSSLPPWSNVWGAWNLPTTTTTTTTSSSWFSWGCSPSASSGTTTAVAPPWLRLPPSDRCCAFVDNECAICLEPYQPHDRVTWSANAACPHAFHTDCFESHATAVLANHHRVVAKVDGIPCPCCRQVFVAAPPPPATVTTTIAVLVPEQAPPVAAAPPTTTRA